MTSRLSDSAQSPAKFDRRTLRRFIKLARPFFLSEQRWKARSLVVLLAMFSVSLSLFNVLMSYIGRDFMTALSLREKDEFIRHLYRYLLAFGGATLLVVFYRYTEERLALIWRRWLSVHLIERYFKDRAYYQLTAQRAIDNPDQRIEEDVRTFTVTSLSFTLIIFNSLIALISFTGILWTISSMLTFAAVGYATLGSIVTYYLGRSLIGLNFTQLKRDADYRYKLINIRDNAELIAFLGGEKKEVTRVRQRMKLALRNMRSLIDWHRNLNFFTTGYNYLITIIPTVIVAPLYLDGTIEFGVVTQATIAFGQVLGALSIIVLNFGSISTFAAVVTRLGSFVEALDSQSQLPVKRSTISVSDGAPLRFEHVTILTPQRDQRIIENLSVEVPHSLLISGTSGSGKSSLLRCIAGLWTSGSGRIIRPPLAESMFVPQRPYLVIGTFRSQLYYPKAPAGLSEARIREVIDQVGLTQTVDRVGGLESVHDWPNMLSTGEQQRVGFARLLIAQPRFVYLDESTTAMDPQSEVELYRLLSSFAELIVSVGYRDSLDQFHQQRLELRGSDSWAILPSGPPQMGGEYT